MVKQPSLFVSVVLLISINASAKEASDIELGVAFDQGLSVVAELTKCTVTR